MLTEDDLRLIIEITGRRIVVPATDEFPFNVVEARRRMGYSKDPAIAQLQTKLSIMLDDIVRQENERNG